MKNGLYSVTATGLDGVELPNGVAVLRNGAMLGGGPYSYYTGSYSSKDGIFKGELVLNLHTPPPSGHPFFNAEDVGMGVTGTYAGDQAELTGIALVGKRSLAVHLILRKLAAGKSAGPKPRRSAGRKEKARHLRRATSSVGENTPLVTVKSQVRVIRALTGRGTLPCYLAVTTLPQISHSLRFFCRKSITRIHDSDKPPAPCKRSPRH